MIKDAFTYAISGLRTLVHGDPETCLLSRIEREEERLGDDASKSPYYQKLVKEYEELERRKNLVVNPAAPAPGRR